MLYDPKWEQQTEETQVQKMINLAADLIEKHGHCQKEVRNASGAMCIVGGLESAFEIIKPDYSAWPECTAAITKTVGGDFIDWNNAPGRTKAEVVAALREAAQS